VEQALKESAHLHLPLETIVYVCIRETGEIVTIAEARDRYRKARWSMPLKARTDPVHFLG
jgi:hypothetical protein